MLTSLSIRNVVLIESLDLDFKAGLTALTGETGAGKSIILDSLGMATGARSDRALIRQGTNKAQCAASFLLETGSPVFTRLAECDIDCAALEDITLRRTLGADGRSKAYINDTPVSVKLLNEIGGLLLEVHGQNDGRGLLDPSTHIELLDLYGGHKAELEACAHAYKTYRKAQADLDALLAKQLKAGDDRDFLTHSIEELDRLDPRAGEEQSLAETRKFLQGAEGALSELSAAQDILSEGGAFEERLASALAGIDRVRAKFGDSESPATKALQNASEALERALLETQDAKDAVSVAAQSFDVEPGRLDETEKRLFALRAAARKYDCQIDTLIDMRANFAQELSSIETVVEDTEASRARAEQARQHYELAAEQLTKARIKSAKDLDQSVLAELPPLKMERAVFETQISEAPQSAKGVDHIRFQVSTNPGTALGPLDKIASGGEMARFALAIKVALAGKTNAVMVFDEVDQGVGGAVADAVGKRLARLSQSAQVFVVTHSPQVAASATQQFRIEKHATGQTTTTHVHAIQDNEREEEIARMLAGETITSEARAAARQLMAS